MRCLLWILYCLNPPSIKFECSEHPPPRYEVMPTLLQPLQLIHTAQHGSSEQFEHTGFDLYYVNDHIS
jgi:hypothetical protein